MFLGRISQSFRIARVPASHPSLRYPVRSLLSSATLYPGRYAVSHDIPSASSSSTFAVSERNDAAASLRKDRALPESAEEPTPPLRTIEDFEAALEHAFVQKHYPAVEAVVDRLVDLYRSETALSFSIFHSLLQREDVRLLSDSSILDILQLIRSSPYEAKCLPPEILLYLSQHRAHDKTIQMVLLDILRLQIQDIEIPNGPRYVQYEPPLAVQQAFSILPSLIVKQPQAALDIFNTLLEKGFIPTESVQDPELLGSDDIVLIMFTGLSKASIHWNLLGLMPEVIKHLFQTKSARHPLVPNSLTALATSLLDNHAASNSRATLRACLAIIRVHRVPDNVIRRFYKNAKDYDCGSEAAELYAFTRGVLGETNHPHPAPRSTDLGWLMQYLYDSGQHSLCQTLAREVLDDRLPIPACYCPSFLRTTVLTSTNNDLRVAKSLWERYVRPSQSQRKEAVQNPDKEDNSLAQMTPHAISSMVRIKKVVQSDGILALAMVQRLSDAIRAKKAQAEKEREIPDNPNFVRLKEDIRRLKVFMHKVAYDFGATRTHFNGTAVELFSYRVQILLIVGRYKDAVQHFCDLIHRQPHKVTADEIRSCWEAMAAQDAGMVAILIQELDRLGVYVDTTTCLNLLARAVEQEDYQVAKDIRKFLLRRGVDLAASAPETLAVGS